jgi:hypothetical protein
MSDKVMASVAAGVCHELGKLSRRVIFTTMDCEFMPLEERKKHKMQDADHYILGFIPGRGKHEPIDLVKVRFGDNIDVEIPFNDFPQSTIGTYEYADPSMLDKLVRDVTQVIEAIDAVYPKGDIDEP